MTAACGYRLRSDQQTVRDALVVVTFESFGELAAAEEEWDGFVEQSGSDVYFTTDWMQVWWSHYGSGRELRCYLVRHGDKIVAALPFCISKLRIGPFTVRLARWVGGDSTLSVLYPAIAPGYEGATLDLACRRLLVEERCDAVSLSPLSGLSPMGNVVEELCRAVDEYYLVRDDSTGPHTIVSLPDSFEEYLDSLSKKTKADILRKRRQLSERCSVQHRVVAGEDVVTCFEGFVALHQKQWRAAGRLGHFGDWPASLAFNRELVDRLARKGRVRFYELCGDDRVISAEYGFVLGDRYYARLSARRTDPASVKLGLGHIGYVKTLEALIAEGVRMMEDGPGRYEYKLRYGATEHSLRRQVIARRTRPARWKMRILLLLADSIHLVYYRIWFLRLSHLLRLPARSLRQFWIRSRV